MECCKIFSFFAALLLFMGSMISWIIYTFLSNKLGEKAKAKAEAKAKSDSLTGLKLKNEY